MKQAPILIALAMTAVCAGAWLWICSGEPALDIDLRPPGPAPRTSEPVPLRLAIAPMVTPERTLESNHAFARYLASRIGRPVQLVQRKTYNEVNELLRNGRIQAAIICTGAYLRAQEDRVPIEVLAVPFYEEMPVYHSLLVVRTDSGIRSIDDLRGRSFAFSDPLSLSGHYYPEALLLEQGHDRAAFFSRTLFTYSHDGSLRAVLDGIVDGAAVDSLVYDIEVRRDPAVSGRLAVIHRSPPLGVSPVVAPASLDPALRESIRRAFIEMDDSPDSLSAGRPNDFLGLKSGLQRMGGKPSAHGAIGVRWYAEQLQDLSPFPQVDALISVNFNSLRII